VEPKDKYRAITYIIAISIGLYIVIGQSVIFSGLGQDRSVTTVFTGFPRLQIRDNVLRLTLKTECRTIEFGLQEPLRVAPNLIGNSHSQGVTLQRTKDWDRFTIVAPEGKSLNGEQLLIQMSDSTVGLPRRTYITDLRLDGRPESIPAFYNRLMVQTESNPVLYYPFQIKNLSSFVSEKIGASALWLILITLIGLAAYQFIMFLISVIWQPEQVKEFFEKEQTKRGASFLDELATRFAIPLGFLGTVVSVWYSLEQSDTDFASFAQMLEIIKVAIFTSVLGLFTKVMCLLRSLQTGILKSKR